MVSNIVELPMQMVFELNLLLEDDLSSILILQSNCLAVEYTEPRSKDQKLISKPVKQLCTYRHNLSH